MIKGIFKEHIINVILNGENECFSHVVENKAELFILIIPTEYSTRAPKSGKLRRKERSKEIGKKRIIKYLSSQKS